VTLEPVRLVPTADDPGGGLGAVATGPAVTVTPEPAGQDQMGSLITFDDLSPALRLGTVYRRVPPDR
jgi:hypothetical protein